MALTVVPSARVFNGNVGTQAYDSGSTNSKCLCCPYGYHIDMDFLQYCEAIAAENASDRSTIERRKKRERRSQCQSMEVLLGLVNPALGIDAEQSKIPQEPAATNGVSTSPRSRDNTQEYTQDSPAFDLSDVVGDFEAALKQFSKSSRISERERNENDGPNRTTPVHNNVQTEQTGVDFDNASVGSGNSNLSTGALQNIREQMAASLERMKELEEQVKTIPILQVQVSVLQEEKRNLLRQVEELRKTTPCNETELHRHRSQSFSEQRSLQQNLRNVKTPTRDMATMCGVMTRDVGVSHQQVRTRDIGMITSTPIKQSLQRSRLQIEEIVPEIEARNSLYRTPSTLDYSSDSRDSWKSPLAFSQLKHEEIAPRTNTRNCLTRSPLQMESIPPTSPKLVRDAKKCRDAAVNTRNRLRDLECSLLMIENIAPEIKKEIKKISKGTTTGLNMKDILTQEDVAVIVDDALRIYKSTLIKDTVSRGCQCTPDPPRAVEKRDQFTQTAEPFKMKTNVGVTVKPRVSEIGIEVRTGPGMRTVAVGPDPFSEQPVSLLSLNTRSHSFNMGDTKIKRRTTRSVGVMVEDLIKTTAKSTDTSGLAPKKVSREFGTSPIRKKFTDVSVGESIRPHISISCAANYCDNCKETIKNLAKQIANNAENNMNHQNTNLVSRIPRPSHIPLNNTVDHRRQFKRQDTYTKIPAGVIRYDADNKESYESSTRIQQLQRQKEKNEKSEEIYNAEQQADNEEKHEIPESALFQPIQEKPRKKVEPSKEMQAAMKVLNDSFKKSPSRNVSHQMKNAIDIIEHEWFTILKKVNTNPLDVEDYLDCFEEYSSTLLEYIVNMTDSNGNTAMHYAVSHGNFDVVSILLDSKVCDINKANCAGFTAVMLAALAEVKNSTIASVAKKLYQLADVNIRAKKHGQTALMLAVSHGREDMTQLLLEAGAAINIQDDDGSTALMCAAEHGHEDIVRLLLAHPDCDSSIVDVDGSSALTIAVEAGNRDIGCLLYTHERLHKGTSPYSSMRRRRGSKPTTPTGSSPSAPVSPALPRRQHSSTVSLNTSKYSK